MFTCKISDKEVQVRELKPEDSCLVYEFFKKLSHETQYFFHPHDFDYKTAIKITEKDAVNPQIIRYAAVIQKNQKEIMIGYVFLWDWHQDIPWLGIGVCDDWQGKGLGKNLLKFMINKVKKNNKKGMQLTTMKDNKKAQGLYKKLGFKIIGKKQEEHWMQILF